MTDLSELLWQIFLPEARRQSARVQENKVRFVHYTSAETGIAILRSGRMLLRNSVLMNDFSEVQHGINCLTTAYNGALGERLKSVMREIQADLPEIVESNFNQQLLEVKNETYITSISEHGDIEGDIDLEDNFGRLSMWRAYANRNGIAFVFDSGPFMRDSGALNAFSSPVVYATPDSFERYFEEIVSGLETNLDALKPLGGALIHDNLMNSFRFAIQSTKHPSFKEEREWRIIYSPTILQRENKMTDDQLKRVPTEIMTLGGVPQRVFAIPFQNYESEGFYGATVPELIDRILIGPSVDAYPIAQAFVAELTKLGVDDAADKVVITGIPLRV